jgi:hypothetical protein
VLISQWADAEPSDLLLVLVFWILPCVSGIYVVIANRLHRRGTANAPVE